MMDMGAYKAIVDVFASVIAIGLAVQVSFFSISRIKKTVIDVNEVQERKRKLHDYEDVVTPDKSYSYEGFEGIGADGEMIFKSDVKLLKR